MPSRGDSTGEEGEGSREVRSLSQTSKEIAGQLQCALAGFPKKTRERLSVAQDVWKALGTLVLSPFPG